MDCIGTFYIYEMELWDEDYFNMEAQAYISINKKDTGNFKFGLVSCDLFGRKVEHKGKTDLSLHLKEWMNVNQQVGLDG